MRIRKQIDLKSGKGLWLFVTIWVIVGSVFFGVGLYERQSLAQFKETALETGARITEIEEIRRTTSKGKTRYDHKVHIEYEVNGESYVAILPHYSSSMNNGDMVNILYDPQNPHEIRSMEEGLFNILFIAFGALGLGIASFAASGYRLRMRKKIAPIVNARTPKTDPTDMRSYRP